MLTFAASRTRVCNPGSWQRQSLAALLLLFVGCRLVEAQVVRFVANGGFRPGNEKVTTAFTLPTQPTDVKDALDEFQRMAKHEQWEKAFKALETIAEKGGTGFIDRGDGILVPGRLVVRRLVAELPAAGKSAYRVFYDAQAEALLEKAVDQQEQVNLEAIVANFLISSVGDRAADRLGDLYFEQGEFDRAATAWRSVLGYCPDTKLAKPRLLLKIATALARAGRRSEFADIEQTILKDHGGEAIVVAGAGAPLSDRLTELKKSFAPVSSNSAHIDLEDLSLPTQVEPLWQFSFLNKVDPRNPQQQPFALVDMYGRPRSNDFVIPAAIDEQRMYVNLFGVEMAFDLESGKLVWRIGKLHALQFQQSRQGAAPELYHIAAHGGRTYSVSRDLQQNNSNMPFALIARDSATGKELFNTRKTLSTWNMQSDPHFDGEVIYLAATRTNQQRELSLLMLNVSDGKLIKNVVIGQHSVDPNQVQGEQIGQSTMLLHRDRLLLDTHAGALVCLQPQSGNLEWGLAYESPPPATGYYYNYAPPPCSLSGPISGGGLIFSKGMRSQRLIGIEFDGPSLAWNRPIDRLAAIVGCDDERLFTSGEELAAYSLKTQEMLWSTPLPRTAAWSKPLVTRNRLYQFTSRGICEIDKQTGTPVRIFRGVDLDAMGGGLLVSSKALVTVSNLGIAAYPRPAAAGGSTEQSPNASSQTE